MGSSYLQNKDPWVYKSPWGYREPVPTRPRSSEDSFEFERLGQLPGPRGPPSWFCHQESAPEVDREWKMELLVDPGPPYGRGLASTFSQSRVGSYKRAFEDKQIQN